MRPGFLILIISICDLVFIRFFTEKMRVLPHMMQLLFPLTTTVVLVYTVLRVLNKGSIRLSYPVFLTLGYILVAAASIFLNLSQLSIIGVYLSLFSWLSPLVFFFAVQYIKYSREEINTLLKCYFIFGIIQFIIIAVYDYPVFLRTGNPDDVSGSFGFNAYQMIFFVSLWLFLVVSYIRSRGEQRHLIGKVKILGAATIVFVTFFLAQWLSILVAFPITVAIFYLLQPGQQLNKFGIAITILLLFSGVLLQMNSLFPELRLFKFYYKLETTDIEKIGKVRLLKSIGSIYFNEKPHYIIVGTGPGTFASRAYQTASGKSSRSRSRTNIFSGSTVSFGGYSTDVANKYIVPIKTAKLQIGSTPDAPQMSFAALLVEFGLLGAVLILGLYAFVLKKARSALKHAKNMGDQTYYVLGGVALGAGLILLQIGFLGTFWESSRVTIPLWIIFGLLFRYEALLQEENAPAVHPEENPVHAVKNYIFR